MLRIINENFILRNGLNWIYRIVAPGDRVGSNKIWGLEAIRIKDRNLPLIDSLYLVPAELTNHLGKTINVLATCNPLHQIISGPFYYKNESRNLVDAEETGFIDSSLGYSTEYNIRFNKS